MYLDGHGEPKLDGRANFDLGDFGQQLATKGFRIQAAEPRGRAGGAGQCRVLVIAPPRVDLLKGEVDKIKRYLERGGNLLWLIDQEPLHGLQPVAEYLRLAADPGRRGGSGGGAAGHRADHRAVGELRHRIRSPRRSSAYNTAFPFVRQIGRRPGGEGLARHARWWRWRSAAGSRPGTSTRTCASTRTATCAGPVADRGRARAHVERARTSASSWSAAAASCPMPSSVCSATWIWASTC